MINTQKFSLTGLTDLNWTDQEKMDQYGPLSRLNFESDS